MGLQHKLTSILLTAATPSALGGVKQAAKVNDASGTVSVENFNGLLTALKKRRYNGKIKKGGLNI